MQIKNKFLVIGLPIAGAAILAGVGIASAAGMMGGGGPAAGFGGGIASVSPATAAANMTTEFQNEASVLNLSESVIVAGWAQGESLQQIATANGISQTQLQTDMKAFQQSQETAELQTLVSNGTITQAQMTSRLAFEAAMQAKMAANPGFSKRGKGAVGATSTATTSNS